ncbi:MAG: nucleotide 5'-monophosphate nucleosidase PpnN [Pseudomonadota bacterium]
MSKQIDLDTTFERAVVHPTATMDLLSQTEVSRLRDGQDPSLAELVRRCALAVLNSGTTTDDVEHLFAVYRDFDVGLVQNDRGLSLELKAVPSLAFVDGKMIRGIREHLFAVVRDLVYVSSQLGVGTAHPLADGGDITNAVFHILRNAGAMTAEDTPNLIVCWGGHSIGREEYEYTKEVGYHLGLRLLNICTGCGPGAMKGPMKGAAVGHAKQRFNEGRYIGLTEPGIIAAEPPNALVNQLVILPDIEKRLEAFARLGHGIVVFPGGVGTCEEILYLLGLLLHPENQGRPYPLIFTGPKASRFYFEKIDEFIGLTLGADAQQLYQIIIDDPIEVARQMLAGVQAVETFRRQHEDAFHFNWGLTIADEFQAPFVVNHQTMSALELTNERPREALAADLRRAFSGIVAGNVKSDGINEIAKHGPFELAGEPKIMAALDELLRGFVSDRRMRIDGDYTPCYVLR